MFEKILSGVKSKQIKYIAQAITLVENDENLILDHLTPMSCNAYRIGVTGPPGAGKSSITNQLIKLDRAIFLNMKIYIEFCIK